MRNFFPIMRFKIKLFQFYSKVKTVVLFAYDLDKAVFCTNMLYKRTSQKHCYILAINLHTLDFKARMELRVYLPCLTTLCQYIKQALEGLTMPLIITFNFVFSWVKPVFEGYVVTRIN